MQKIALITLAIFVMASLTVAQVPTSGNIFFGYSYESTDWSGIVSGLARPNLHGWEASLEGKVFPHVGIVADFGGHYGSESFNVETLAGLSRLKVTGHQWEVLFGPRLSIPIGKISPFAEAMFGIAHIHNGGAADDTNTSFATAIGGGMDYRLARILAARVEIDWLRTHFFNTTQNNLRFSPGLVFRF
jgi:opacity protein-like surface antigen